MGSTKGTKRAAPEAAGAAAPAVDERTKRIKKLTPLEHVILKPTMYVGATDAQTHARALLTVRKIAAAKPDESAAPVSSETTSDSDAEGDAPPAPVAGSPPPPKTPAKATVELSARIEKVEFVPALLKIFDEVVTNALDVAVKEKDVRNIIVTCNGNTVTVKNDGSGLPVEFHHEVKDVRVPELIFSHLNTGSNYDDDSERLVAGQNGLGVKLANIFSDRFTVKVRDGKTGDTYEQTWTDRMSKSEPAKVKFGKPKKEPAKDAGAMDEGVIKKRQAPPGGFVEVSFAPIAELMAPHGAIAGSVLEELFAARALDIALAAPASVRVSFNGVTLKVPNLKAYMQLFVGKEGVIHVDDSDPNWKVGVALAPKDSNGCVRALVNGVSANHGNHVQHVENQLYSAVVDDFSSKRGSKDVSLKNYQLKSSTFLFVVANMKGVTFNSQTKENCTGGSPITYYKPSPAMVKKMLASDIVGEAASAEKTRAAREMARKTDGKKTATVNVPKLQDAEWAGTKQSAEASLILTEGDSARSFAIAGLPVLGFDKYGVFPLRGKLLNTREASAKQLTDNAEIKNLKTILALKEGSKHEGGDGLRYGSIIILTDSDADGSHIRGLILNFLHSKWPELAKSGFVRVWQTPIVRAKKVRKHAFCRQRVPRRQIWTVHHDIRYARFYGHD
jgi:DNA topoisomerase-2